MDTMLVKVVSSVIRLGCKTNQGILEDISKSSAGIVRTGQHNDIEPQIKFTFAVEKERVRNIYADYTGLGLQKDISRGPITVRQ
jgi:hypothetical protein